MFFFLWFKMKINSSIFLITIFIFLISKSIYLHKTFLKELFLKRKRKREWQREYILLCLALIEFVRLCSIVFLTWSTYCRKNVVYGICHNVFSSTKLSYQHSFSFLSFILADSNQPSPAQGCSFLSMFESYGTNIFSLSFLFIFPSSQEFF